MLSLTLSSTVQCSVSIRNRKKLHLKVSQGEYRGDRMNFFQYGWQKTDKSNFHNFIDFETSSMMLFKNKVSKNAPKHEIV